MLPLEYPDPIQISFDDPRLVANAGLLLPVTLAQHLGLPQLVQECLDLGDAPGRANTGDKMMTLVASALAGGDCIDDAVALRTGGTAGALGCVVKVPSTLGTFRRSFRWGHVRQLDRVSRELLARAWAAGAGPVDGPLTIDLDSTSCETYGLAKEGARHYSYTSQRGYHLCHRHGPSLRWIRGQVGRITFDTNTKAQLPALPHTENKWGCVYRVRASSGALLSATRRDRRTLPYNAAGDCICYRGFRV